MFDIIIKILSGDWLTLLALLSILTITVVIPICFFRDVVTEVKNKRKNKNRNIPNNDQHEKTDSN